MSDVKYAELTSGFEYGAAKVTRLFSDENRGWVVLGVETPKQSVQVYVTKTGKVRVHGTDGREWKPQEPTG